MRLSRNLLGYCLIALIAAVFILSRFFSPFHLNSDESFFLWQGALVRDGLIPYRDFFEPKPPMIFWANALGLKLFGFHHGLFRLIPSLMAVLSLTLFVLALYLRRLSAGIALALAIQCAYWLAGPQFHDGSLNDAETYGFAWTLIGFSLVSMAVDLPEKGRLRTLLGLLGGAGFGLAILSKELFLLSAVPAAWLATLRPNKIHVRAFGLAAAGAASVGALFVLELIATGSLFPYLDVVSFYRSFAARYCIDIGQFPDVSGFSVIAPSLQRLRAQLFNLHNLCVVLPLIGAGLFLERRIWMRLMILGSLVAGALAISTGHCFWKHYPLMGTSALLFSAVWGAEKWDRWPVPSSRVRSVGLGCLFLALAFAVLPDFKAALLGKKNTPEVAASSEVAEVIQRHSSPGDFVLTTGGPALYLVSDRKNPFRSAILLDAVLPYLSAHRYAETLEKLRPSVVYAPMELRSQQQKLFQTFLLPYLTRHRFVQHSQEIWYAPPK